mmetsp:Transcript_19961/g.60588  ORF Transcript_19961/g.60588 Transcript_19961/m.60588 type:complete len:341 (-) Transcript_19961:1755-2777(-)
MHVALKCSKRAMHHCSVSRYTLAFRARTRHCEHYARDASGALPIAGSGSIRSTGLSDVLAPSCMGSSPQPNSTLPGSARNDVPTDVPFDVFAAAARALSSPHGVGAASPPQPLFVSAVHKGAQGSNSALALAGAISRCYEETLAAPLAPMSPDGTMPPAATAAGCAPPPPAAERAVLAMAKNGISAKLLDALPLGVAMPLREAIRACRHAAPADWPEAALALIGREDLARTFRAAPRAAPVTLPPAGTPAPSPQDDPDGMLAVIAAAGLRFRRDLRLVEVRRNRDGQGHHITARPATAQLCPLWTTAVQPAAAGTHSERCCCNLPVGEALALLFPAHFAP